MGLPTDCAAVLLMETDGHPAAVADEAGRMAALARTNGAREVRLARDEAEALALASARRNAFSALARRRPTTILEDFTVPRSELAAMVTFIAETARASNLEVGTFGHMGDGNLHPTFLTDERDAEEMARVHHALDLIAKKTLELGGTSRRARSRPREEAVAAPADGEAASRCETDQARARSGRPPQPGRSRLIDGQSDATHHGLRGLQQCMHCGMCLATCRPTTRRSTNGTARAAASRDARGGRRSTRHHPRFEDEMIYCLAAWHARPLSAGVNYAELFETARSDIECAMRTAVLRGNSGAH